MYSIFLMFFSFLLYSCTPTPPHVKAGDLLISKFSKQVYENENLYLSGSGGSFLDNDIKSFDLMFYCNRKFNIEEARYFLLENTEYLLEIINFDSNIEPYLNHKPFDHDDVNVLIAFLESSGIDNYVKPPLVALVLLKDGYLRYTTFNPVEKSFNYLHEESYLQAYEIFQNQKKNEFQEISNEKKPLVNIKSHLINNRSCSGRTIDAILKETGQKTQVNHGIR